MNLQLENVAAWEQLLSKRDLHAEYSQYPDGEAMAGYAGIYGMLGCKTILRIFYQAKSVAYAHRNHKRKDQASK